MTIWFLELAELCARTKKDTMESCKVQVEDHLSRPRYQQQKDSVRDTRTGKLAVVPRKMHRWSCTIALLQACLLANRCAKQISSRYPWSENRRHILITFTIQFIDVLICDRDGSCLNFQICPFSFSSTTFLGDSRIRRSRGRAFLRGSQ